MTTDDLFAPLARMRGNAAVVTTMAAVRAWARHSNRELDFASADSAMGHAADLALGIALAQPDRKVICLNGDGSMLMSLGTLVTIVESGVENLILIVLENRTYEITGNQAVPGAGAVDYAALAKAAGFKRTCTWNTAAEAETEIPEIMAAAGPVFVVARTEPGAERPLKRGPAEPERYLQTSLAESARIVRRALGRFQPRMDTNERGGAR
jgi:thiamine pyrophosphate-dependent acetolactate synthase large subunit-like protein